jgi:hypothetical protein
LHWKRGLTDQVPVLEIVAVEDEAAVEGAEADEDLGFLVRSEADSVLVEALLGDDGSPVDEWETG